jgi:hypothetical protein
MVECRVAEHRDTHTHTHTHHTSHNTTNTHTWCYTGTESGKVCLCNDAVNSYDYTRTVAAAFAELFWQNYCHKNAVRYISGLRKTRSITFVASAKRGPLHLWPPQNAVRYICVLRKTRSVKFVASANRTDLN